MNSEQLKKISIRLIGRCSGLGYEICDNCEMKMREEYYYAHRMLFKQKLVKWEYSMLLNGVEALIREDKFSWEGPEHYGSSMDLEFSAPLYGPRNGSRKSLQTPLSKDAGKIEVKRLPGFLKVSPG